tara:strand:- start:1083 stop:1562 length:480 start_codon:yes stop_codon:yes gene_type:complete
MKKHLEAFLLVVMGILVIFISTIAASFVRIETALPLENFNGRIISPIDISTQNYIKAEGTFSRRVTCILDDFILTITHDDGDVLHFGKESLRTAPIAAATGDQHQIQFEVRIPNDIKLGWWVPVFTGSYDCKYGLLDSYKTQRLMSPSFKIINNAVGGR